MNGSHRQAHGFEYRRGHRQKDGHEEGAFQRAPEDVQNHTEENQGRPGSKRI